MLQLMDYIVSLTNLYGLVHKTKVVEIYNMQNDEKVSEESIDHIMEHQVEKLEENFVEINGDYFVTDTINDFEEFAEQLRKRKGKPFYIPEKEDLLKYRENGYFEQTKEYKALYDYFLDMLDGDEFKAERMSEDAQGLLHVGASISRVIEMYTEEGLVFVSEQQMREVVDRLVELANNIRMWENNGHTPKEMGLSNESTFHMETNRFSNVQKTRDFKKVGRNDPCPCGSGKKYKKCCGM